MNTLYKRVFYLEKIQQYLGNTGLIKVLIGQRRVGKSTLMKQIIEFLQSSLQVGLSQIISINLEVEYMKYPTIDVLHEYIMSRINQCDTHKRVYLFIDEVQEILGREKLLNSYRANDTLDIEIFITGSNANLLSSDLATYLSGRYISFEIMPFSYGEFVGYVGYKIGKESFLEYMNFSGIPELYNFDNPESQRSYLKSIQDSIILKDIIKRYAIKDVDLLEKVFYYLAGNIGNLFSLNNMVKKLASIGITSNTTTLGNYIHYLEKTFIIHGVSRYDIQGKKILEGDKKYYLNDLAFNNFFSSNYDIGGGKKLENIVYNHLKQYGYSVYIGTMGNLEIDFIAERGKEKLYIQVAYIISSEEVFHREFRNLEKIKDNYKKVIVSLDDVLIDHKGIIHENIWEFISRRQI